MSNHKCHAATECTTRACIKRLDETQWPETRDETYLAEIETYCSETRPRRWGFCPTWDWDDTLVRLETISRPRRLDRDHIPGCDHLQTSYLRQGGYVFVGLCLFVCLSVYVW